MGDAGIDDLIVDFRYNPGDRTRVAEQFASQIVGSAFDGESFLSRVWNNKYTQFNQTSALEVTTPTLALPRVIVLMTESSASASKAMVNGLGPYINVVVIGGATTGKIFTSNARGYCGKSINAMRSIRTNSVGVSVDGVYSQIVVLLMTGRPTRFQPMIHWYQRLWTTCSPVRAQMLQLRVRHVRILVVWVDLPLTVSAVWQIGQWILLIDKYTKYKVHIATRLSQQNILHALLRDEQTQADACNGRGWIMGYRKPL